MRCYFFVIILFFSVFRVCALELEVKFSGIDEKLVEQISSNVMIYKAQKEPRLVDTRIYNLHEAAHAEILEALASLGYYHAKVKSSLSESPKLWKAGYRIDLGQPTLLNKIEIKVIGNIVKDINYRTVELKKLQKDKTITHADYEDAKSVLLDDLQSKGYLRAKINISELQINRQSHTATVKIELDSGPRYYFGDVEFEDPPYDSTFLKRFLPFKHNEPYTKEMILELQRNLNDADMFSKIRIVPNPDLSSNPKLNVPVKIRLISKNKNRYTASAGYGTDTGPRISGTWQHRRMSTAGHKVNTGVRLSKIRKHAFIDYTIPGKKPAYDYYLLTSKVYEENVRDEYSRRGEIGASTVLKRDKLEHKYGLQFLAESYRFSKNEKIIGKQFFMPSARWIYTDKNELSAWWCGLRLELAARGSLKGAVADTSMLQAEASAKWLHPITDSTRFILFGKIGSTAAKKFDDIPLSLRYFSGGDRTIRGFAYRSLGPKRLDSKGKSVVVGGKHLINTTAEIEQKLTQELSAAIFYDLGNALAKWSDKLASGGGIGFRWATPVGSFRLDVAKQLSQIQQKNIRFHLTFGTDL